MNDVFRAMDAKFPKGLRDDGIVIEGNAALVDLSKATLVDELTQRLERRIAIGDVGLNGFQHVQDGLVNLQEDAIVELLQTKKLQHLAWLWAELDDTHDASDKQKRRLRLHKEVSCGLGLPPGRDELSPKGCVFLVILQGAHLQVMPRIGTLLLLRSRGCHFLLRECRIACKLQLHALGNHSAICNALLCNRVTISHGSRR